MRRTSPAWSRSTATPPPDRARVLLDTNVLVSAIVFGGSSRRLLEAALHGEVTVITSTWLLDELVKVLQAKFEFSPLAAGMVRVEVEGLAEVVAPAKMPAVCRDSDDDRVLAAAQAGAVTAIITGDRDLLDLGSFEGIPIIAPADYDLV